MVTDKSPNSKPMIDKCGASISVNIMTGLVRIDGMPVFRVISSNDGSIRIQFADNDRMKSRARGTRFIEIPADVLFDKLLKSCS